jgi:hypothetical protein
MSVPSWNPPRELSRREQTLLRRRTKKFFGFLRQYRHELFDDGFQKELASMYRGTGEGKEPVAPALLAMVTLLQAYTGASDAEAVDLSMDNARWQIVLGVLGEEEAPFSQGVLSPFRDRLIAHEMDRRLLERTVSWRGAPAASTRRSCRRRCGWRSIQGRSSEQVGSRILSTY